MSSPTPLYTRDNCTFSCPLQWGLSAFWRTPETDSSWLSDLTAANEVDGIRLLGHRFESPGISQFAASTLPNVPPLLVVQRVKGRLQHMVRTRLPKAFRGNYAIRSIGHVTRETIERYVADQLGHHRMADPRVQSRLARFQIERPEVDLSQPQRTSHGLYWYNLHVVLVHQERWPEIREEVLQQVHDMILRVADGKKYLLSRAGISADHVHLVLGCPIETAPDEIAFSFLNNLAYAHGMRPVYQYGAIVGTVGEYTTKTLDLGTPIPGDEFPAGGDGP